MKMSQLNVSIPANTTASDLDLVLSKNFEALTAGSWERSFDGSNYFSKDDIFVSDTAQKYVLISSSVQINEKVNLFNVASQLNYNASMPSGIKYISMSSPDQMNHLFYVTKMNLELILLFALFAILKTNSYVFLFFISTVSLAS